MKKRIYHSHEGTAQMKDLLGGKGANIAEMKQLKLAVPSGFTITTETCMDYLADPQATMEEIRPLIADAIDSLEKETGKGFSNPEKLLLVSVRSGAKISMPGMMDTILNLGLNDQNVEFLAQATQDRRFALDCYRRLLQMFGDVVYAIPGSAFEEELANLRFTSQVETDADLTEDQLSSLIEAYKAIYKQYGKTFPSDPELQLEEAIKAVFDSWNNQRAKVYRRLNNIDDQMGTAVNIQEMVFGNSGENSGTGVAFTRNPATGDNQLYGEYLLNAQGEDVVAGIRTPENISRLAEVMPEVYQEFVETAHILENHYSDMQDIEFTIEDGKLYILQTRNGKRTAQAAFRIAVDLVEEGLATKEEALLSLDPDSIDQLLHPAFDESSLEKAQVISSAGLPASPGAARGKLYFDAETAKKKAAEGEAVILARIDTSPEDIEGMSVSQAIVTSTGGMTSHAAVVARGMGRCCVSGASDIEISYEDKTLSYPGGRLEEGDELSVDGSTGKLYLGLLDLTAAASNDYFQTIMDWARDLSRMKVRMNAETLKDIKQGLAFDADGIGLVRTEHMFFGQDRLLEMRRFILARSEEERQEALANILPYQVEDFLEIFKLLDGKPAVIRLLDPPLHEFIPHTPEDIKGTSEKLGVAEGQLKQTLKDLSEVNPMLGHRGGRLAVSYPELYQMQAEAIITAASQLKNAQPEIMIPLVGSAKELAKLRQTVVDHLEEVQADFSEEISYTVGTMMEIPRACLTADEMAVESDFFSFGTNDLTQMTFGFSRDDSAKFIQTYLKQGLLKDDPFQTIDIEGVGQLIQVAVEKGRKEKADLKMGVCGELGGDPRSIEFFEQIGLDYVSCSPFRIPTAQLAVAQAHIRSAKTNS